MSRKKPVLLLLILTLIVTLAAGCAADEEDQPEVVEGDEDEVVEFEDTPVPPSDVEPTVPPTVVAATIEAGDTEEEPADDVTEEGEDVPAELADEAEPEAGIPIAPDTAGALELLETITLETEAVTSVDWSPGERLLAAVTPGGVFLVDVDDDQLPISINPTDPTAEDGEVGPELEIVPGRVEFAPALDILAVEPATPEGRVTLWDISDPYEPGLTDLDELNEVVDGASRIAFGLESDLLAISGMAEPDTVTVWNLEGGELWLQFEVEGVLPEGAGGEVTFPIEHLNFSPDGSRLAVTPGASALVRIYDMRSETAEVLQEFDARDLFDSAVARAAIASDWETLVWISEGTVVLVDMETGEVLQEFEHEDFVEATALSLDGRLLATSSAETIEGELVPVVKLWDTETGEAVTTLTGFNDVVQAIAFSDDGSFMATGSGDGNIMLWGIGATE